MGYHGAKNSLPRSVLAYLEGAPEPPPVISLFALLSPPLLIECLNTELIFGEGTKIIDFSIRLAFFKFFFGRTVRRDKALRCFNSIKVYNQRRVDIIFLSSRGLVEVPFR